MLYPEGLLAAVWYGSGEELPLGYARQLDGNGGDACCGGVTLAKRWLTVVNRGNGVWVRHGIPRGFAVPQFGMVRAKQVRRGVLR